MAGTSPGMTSFTASTGFARNVTRRHLAWIIGLQRPRRIVPAGKPHLRVGKTPAIHGGLGAKLTGSAKMPAITNRGMIFIGALHNSCGSPVGTYPVFTQAGIRTVSITG
jgi:hypothetical protein